MNADFPCIAKYCMERIILTVFCVFKCCWPLFPSTTNSTAGSCDTDFSKGDKQHLKDYIQQLKNDRAAVKLTMLELESVHIDPLSYEIKSHADPHQLDLENAVLMQELMAMKVHSAYIWAHVSAKALYGPMNSKFRIATGYRFWYYRNYQKPHTYGWLWSLFSALLLLSPPDIITYHCFCHCKWECLYHCKTLLQDTAHNKVTMSKLIVKDSTQLKSSCLETLRCNTYPVCYGTLEFLQIWCLSNSTGCYGNQPFHMLSPCFPVSCYE